MDVAHQPPESTAEMVMEETRGPRRILVVEDHADTVRVMVRLLRSHGYEVESAGDVQSALQVARQIRFDLLISDLGLPDRTGMELLHELRRRQPIPAIALTGLSTADDVRQSKQAGFTEHLIKPINFQVLLRAIQRLAP